MAGRLRRSFWVWGSVDDEPDEALRRERARQLSRRFGVALEVPPAPRLEEVELRAPRLRVPASLGSFCSSEKAERASHAHGGHPLELLRGFRREFPTPPDAVAHPGDEEELERVLAWCCDAGHAAIPFGGGTSVVGGVTPPAEADGVVSISLDRLARVLEIDDVSRAARIQAGALGPELEAGLRPAGLTLRHFPQSFPWSTLGGWIATRAGGHYATQHTHIDDFVESVRMLTPSGWWESRRLPGSGAGPSPDRLVLGSEGILGIVTEAWMRIQARPRFRASAEVTFASWRAGWEATRRLVQARLWPANLRLLDPLEAAQGAGQGGERALLLVGFESAEVPQVGMLREALRIARECGGEVAEDAVRSSEAGDGESSRGGATQAWRRSFVGVGAVVSAGLGLGLVADTFETAVTWDRWPALDAAVRAAVSDVMDRELRGGVLSCRFTHVYPDGPAPYYTFAGLGTPGGEVEQWSAIKQAATGAILDAGGTVTHHHAVGRLHRPGWERQRPPLFAEVLRAAKRVVDPAGVLNPGVLLDPI